MVFVSAPIAGFLFGVELNRETLALSTDASIEVFSSYNFSL